MSHIFDALQRSEADRPGANQAANVSATELLQHAERHALLQWEADSILPGAGEEPFTSAEVERALHALPSDSPTEVDSGVGDALADDKRSKAFELFRQVESSPLAENRLVCLTDNEGPAAESFRLLRVRLRHLRKDRCLKKVLVTSTVPQEGKSFAAGNLACALAQGSEERVLLLEGDLRRPALSRLFEARVGSGICECVLGSQDLTSSIYRLNGAGIWLFPAGSARGDPLEVIQSARLPILMEQLSGWFDWIIMDSPPMLPMADTTALARLADGILLVTRRDVTQKRKLEKGLGALEPDKLVGALLNSAKNPADSDYYYYRHGSAATEQTVNA